MSSAKARHAEIDRRYKNDKRERQPAILSGVRISELCRLFRARYGALLPEDDAGRDDALIMAHHLAHRPDAERRIKAWLQTFAPWMASDEAQSLIRDVLANALRWRADALAKRLNLTEAERRHLRITTIGAIDAGRAERIARRCKHARDREQQRRRAKGATSRSEYEANSITRAKPWVALGISRRTWYRRGKPAIGTSP
jgi:hypothetical protein